VALLRLVFIGAVLALAATAVAQSSVDVPIERYREAVTVGEVGGIRGRAFQERRRPLGSDLPLTGTTVTLLPRSEAWLLRLQAIKRGARDSVDAYREAATIVRQSREAYDKNLLEAVAGDLSKAATVDSEGRFTLDGVPAGPWILFASRVAYVDKTQKERPGSARAPGQSGLFLPPDRLAGYHIVTYWLRELTVVGGAVEAVELTDRNVWFTGVAEKREPPRLPDQPRQPRR
jgi:hypothetical protein